MAAPEPVYANVLASVLKNKDFEAELYRCTLDIAVNRLESQTKDLSENDLLLFIQDLFSVSSGEHEKAVARANQNALSHDCVVRAVVEKAENLAAKDVDGSSDPYCMLSIVPSSQFTNLKSKKYPTKQTKVVDSNLNPVWNETIEITITRDRVNDSYFQIQVWDCDGTNASKKIKGVKGVKRYVKEVAQSVTTRNNQDDDFMGFNSVPLVNIPSEGLETWFKLRTANSFQAVSGRIKVKLGLSSIKDDARAKSKYTDDVIYAGLLRKVVLKAYNQYTDKTDESTRESWNGNLPLPAKTLVRELEEQYQLPGLPAAIARWEVYAALHTQRPPGVDIIFMEGMLNNLEENRQYADKYVRTMQFTVEMLCRSIKLFIHEECKKIAQHRNVFSSEKNDYVIHLGSVLLIFKKLGRMGLYHLLRTLDPSMPSDVRLDVIHALERGTTEYYMKLYEKLLDESVNQTQTDATREKDKPHGGPEVQILTKLTEALHTDLIFGKAAYHNVFLKVLDIDYVSHVTAVISKHISREASTTMERVNDSIATVHDPHESENKSSALFRFYLAIRDLAEVAKKKDQSSNTNSNKTMRPNSLRRKVDSLRGNSTELDSPPIAIYDYHEWFRPVVLRWLQMSRGRTHILLKKAVEVDNVTRVDDIVKHTSSAVDTIACLTGINPVDAYTIALRLTDDMASAIEKYADLVNKKLHAVGFFDDEGQFDVTEELCLALNNLQYVKSFLEDVDKKMEFMKIAEAVDRHPEGPSGERVMSTFSSLINSANIGMKKKIQAITAVVGVKMKPDIRRYLRMFAQDVTRNETDSGYHRNHDTGIRAKLERKADEAIRPLMSYLNSNIISLNEWLCEPNFRRILDVLWDETLRGLIRIALKDFVEQKPGFFYQCRYVFNNHLSDFFHAEGAGLSMQKIRKRKESRLLDSELKMRCARTKDLIKLFYMHMFEEQQKFASKPLYGILNVFAWYDLNKQQVNVDIISANKLLPLDINGLSDPFVQIRLAPVMLFRNQRSHQTLVEKATLDPIWENESFSFKVEPALAAQEGTAILFTVLDHDVISSNDLEGEAVLPLSMLDGLQKHSRGSAKDGQRHFRLALTQPQKVTKSPRKRHQISDENANVPCGEGPKSQFSDISLDDSGLDFESSLVVSPLYLLRGRGLFDKDADEFCRWRAKLERSTDEEETKRASKK